MQNTIPAPVPRSRRGSLFKERLLLVSPPVAFIGDSILAKFSSDEGQSTWETYYSPLQAGNMSTVGDSTQMVLEKLDRNMLPLEETHTVVLMIGATDLRHKLKVAVVFEQIRKIIQMLQAGCKPGVKILLLGILHRGDENLNCNDSIAEVNELLSGLENGFTVRFVNLENKFFDKGSGHILEEMFDKDRINLVSKGYETLAQSIAPVLKECLEEK